MPKYSKQPTTTNERLEDHSKRLAAVETAQVHFANQQQALIHETHRIKEVLWGSDNPNEISIREQINEIKHIVKKLEELYASNQAEAVRLGKLERDNILDWIRNNPKLSLFIAIVFVSLFVSDIRHPLLSYFFGLNFSP